MLLLCSTMADLDFCFLFIQFLYFYSKYTAQALLFALTAQYHYKMDQFCVSNSDSPVSFCVYEQKPEGCEKG